MITENSQNQLPLTNINIPIQNEIIEIIQQNETSSSDDDDTIEFINPKQIHNHFQLMKNQTLTDLNQFRPRLGWTIMNNTIPHNKAMYMGEYNGLNYYAAIDDNISRKFNDQQNDMLIKALEKGIVRREKGQNGIKFIANNASLG